MSSVGHEYFKGKDHFIYWDDVSIEDEKEYPNFLKLRSVIIICVELFASNRCIYMHTYFDRGSENN